MQISDTATANPPLEQSCADLIKFLSIILKTDSIFFFESSKLTVGHFPPTNLWTYSKYSEPPSSFLVSPIIKRQSPEEIF